LVRWRDAYTAENSKLHQVLSNQLPRARAEAAALCAELESAQGAADARVAAAEAAAAQKAGLLSMLLAPHV
jgi:hypothetical protein